MEMAGKSDHMARDCRYSKLRTPEEPASTDIGQDTSLKTVWMYLALEKGPTSVKLDKPSEMESLGNGYVTCRIIHAAMQRGRSAVYI